MTDFNINVTVVLVIVKEQTPYALSLGGRQLLHVKVMNVMFLVCIFLLYISSIVFILILLIVKRFIFLRLE